MVTLFNGTSCIPSLMETCKYNSGNFSREIFRNNLTLDTTLWCKMGISKFTDVLADYWSAGRDLKLKKILR